MTSFAFSSLGSGSKGNATLVRCHDTLILVDCGFTLKETEKRLARLGVSPEALDAVIVTHEHGDHIKGVGPIVRKYQLPLHITAGTLRNKRKNDIPDARIIHNYTPFSVKSFKVTPVAVPHDASEPAQYIIECQDKRLGILTDLGNVSPHVERHYQACDALILEANHDPAMLASGPYPYSLKQRVGGGWGHLSNQQAARFLQSVNQDKLECLVIAHISQQNNTLSLVQQAFADVLGAIDRVVYACQDEGFGWISV
ncbi:MBL fold metallo-hydrolase [Candidatus Endobugula sertula]|uniref:MBL fold metallo-hydrolase n=1 Tax=Candidatus Endobugula sertula TaxID=62101 RepID=A0A1D2QNA9_9GAMM|nr:MBL fold metallo-hydrolase [Candidatus Endobugula sertula]